MSTRKSLWFQTMKTSNLLYAGISFDEFQLQGEVSLDLRGLDDQMFAIFVSFAEIYNEYIYDLLVEAPAKGKHRPVLKVSQDKHQNYYIKGEEIESCM